MRPPRRPKPSPKQEPWDSRPSSCQSILRTCPTSPPRDACAVCKRHIFTELLRIAGDAQLCDGTNHSDLAVYRPGRKALEELGIRSPLAEADISKDEIRSLGAALGFRNPGQMARPCLLTRFPTA